MNWIKQNSFFLLLFFVFSTCTISAIVLTAPEKESVSEVEVEQGESLWELASKYGSETPQTEWIKTVMELNDLNSPTIRAGEKIVVPTTKPLVSERESEIAGETNHD